MKRILIVLLLAVLCVFSFACTEKETTYLAAKKNSFYLALGGSVNIEDYLEKEGNGKLNVAVENPDVLSLEGSRVRGIAEGKGAIVVESNGFYVRIEIVVVDDKRVRVSVADTTAEYDGKAHLPELSGALPQGSTVAYTCDGAAFSGATDAGEYTVSVEVSVPDPFYVEYEKKTSTLIVTPKVIDMSGVSFTSATYRFDGKEKTLTLGGNLPEGVAVSYENNSATEVGSYRAVAKFTVPDERNYAPIDPLGADLVIKKSFITLETLGFAASSVLYDGKPHSIVFTSELPDGVEFSYYLADGTGKKPLDKTYSFTQSGEYVICASLSVTPYLNRNYAFVSSSQTMEFEQKGDRFYSLTDATARLTVRKCSFYNDYVWKLVRKTSSGEEKVTSVPYGKEFSVGGTTEYSLRLQGTSHGTDGEYPEGASVVYSSLPLNSYGNVDSGVYIVTASFVMPEGSEKNYNPIDDTYFSLTVSKGTFDMDAVVFSAPVSEATYDPDVVYNDLGVDGSALPGFSENLSVDYIYYVNGNKIGKWQASGEICSAAEYTLVASFTVICADKKNYSTPADMTLEIKIKPVTVSLNVSMEDVTVTYDGNLHGIAVTGELPEGVTLGYYCGTVQNASSIAFIDADVYNVVAVFGYKGWAAVNYVLKNGDEEIKELFAALTINKALASVDRTRYTQASIPTFSETLTVGNIAVSGNDDGFLHWKNPEEKIKLIGSDASAHTAWTDPIAVYNPDSKNYTDYEFAMRVTVAQHAVDLSGVTVPTQFVAYTGKKVEPVVFYGDAIGDFLTASVTSDTDLISCGKHLCTVTLAVKNVHGYYLTGENVFGDVVVYVYNSALYTYAPGTASLVSYLGSSPSVSIPEGTQGIRSGAFANASETYSLYLPDTLEVIVSGGLSGATKLEELSMARYIGLSGVFGNSDNVLKKVTIRRDTTVPERAFANQIKLTEIVYESDVTSVGKDAFNGCYYLEKVTFPNVPETFGESAFGGCRSLQELTVRTFSTANYLFGSGSKERFSLQKITVTTRSEVVENAFSGLTCLTEIAFPSGVTSVGKNAFDGISATVDLSCSEFAATGEYAFAGFCGELTLPASLTTISSYAFSACKAEDVLLPKSVTSVSENAFYDCTSQITFASDSVISLFKEGSFRGYAGSSFTLPTSVKTLGKYAFEKSKLTSVSVPSGVVVGEGCFKQCELMESAELSCETIGKEAFYGCKKLTSLTLVGTVSVGDSAFYSCAMTELDLPATITELGASAFYDCPLSIVTMRAETPPAVRTSVFATNRQIAFYVPSASKSQYETYVEGVGCDMTKCTVNGLQ